MCLDCIGGQESKPASKPFFVKPKSIKRPLTAKQVAIMEKNEHDNAVIKEITSRARSSHIDYRDAIASNIIMSYEPRNVVMPKQQSTLQRELGELSNLGNQIRAGLSGVKKK